MKFTFSKEQAEEYVKKEKPTLYEVFSGKTAHEFIYFSEMVKGGKQKEKS